MQLQQYFVDVVIVGGGGAGLMAAISCSEQGKQVLCVSKVHPLRSHTVAAKGGINAALSNIDEDDWLWHMYDTIKGGDWLCDHDSVLYMCQNATKAILDLENMGVTFSRTPEGKIDQRVYGGQSSIYGKGKPPHRACFVADRTGHAILQTMYQQALRSKVRFMEDNFVFSLIGNDQQCCGVVAWDFANGCINIIRAYNVIIATGGFSQAFAVNTSASICTGDGTACALRAGIPLQDMEFVQFHPTGLYNSGILITEAARSKGGTLVNNLGESFMENYAPHYGDLAARDVIARAMVSEINEGRGVGQKADHLYLDLTKIDANIIQQHLPNVSQASLKFAGVDVTRQPIPVAPSAHFTNGGIPTNCNGQALNKDGNVIEGLFAIGEAACSSVHGANRLGCNGLLELVTFGKAVSQHLVDGQNLPHKQHPIDSAINYIEGFLSKGSSDQNSTMLRKKLQQTMSQYASVLRDYKGLETAKQVLESIKSQIPYLRTNSTSLLWNNELLNFMELDNLVMQSLCVVNMAIKRTESRGCHFRSDHQKRNDEKWLKHGIITYDEGKFHFSSLPVRTTSISSKNTNFSIAQRNY